MSQINLHEIIWQQQEQLAAMQVQIQALLVAQGEAGRRREEGDPTWDLIWRWPNWPSLTEKQGKWGVSLRRAGYT